MKKYVLVMAAIMFGMFLMPLTTDASPHFGKKDFDKKHDMRRSGKNHRNAMAYHQYDKIQAMKSIAKADGRISPKERAIIKYEQRKMVDSRHPQRKHGRGNCHARR